MRLRHRLLLLCLLMLGVSCCGCSLGSLNIGSGPDGRAAASSLTLPGNAGFGNMNALPMPGSVTTSPPELPPLPPPA